MIIPDRAITYILFQRTAYLRFPVAPLYRLANRLLPFQTPLYNLVVAVESRLRAGKVKALYAADMQAEYESIRPALPSRCRRVLDIGCGVAGIDVLLDRHYAGEKINLYLLDKSAVEARVFYLFKPQGAFYNSLDVARELLTRNGVAPERVHLIEADARNTIAIDAGIDLALSLLSWGFHYPVATYVERVAQLLSADGVAILDVRKGTDGLDVLHRVFGAVEVLRTTPKYDRVMARKGGRG